MWNNTLQRFQGVSIALQAVDLDLCTAVDLVGSLRGYVASLRDSFDAVENVVKIYLQQCCNSREWTHRDNEKNKKHADDPTEHETAGQSLRSNSEQLCLSP